MINFADIAIILIFVIFCIVGYFRGFMRSLTKLLGSFVSLIIAMLLCNWVCSLICLTELDNWMLDYFIGTYDNLGGSMHVFTDGGDPSVISQALTSVGIPQFISGIMAKMMLPLFPGEPISVANLLALFTVQSILVVSVTILLFIVIRLLVKLLNGLIKLGLKDRLFKIIDRILGFLFGAIKAFLLVFAIFLVGGYFIEQSYGTVLKNQIEQGSISSKLYNNNPLKTLWDKYVNIEGLLETFKDKLLNSDDEGSKSASNSTNQAYENIAIDTYLNFVDLQLDNAYRVT